MGVAPGPGSISAEAAIVAIELSSSHVNPTAIADGVPSVRRLIRRERTLSTEEVAVETSYKNCAAPRATHAARRFVAKKDSVLGPKAGTVHVDGASKVPAVSPGAVLLEVATRTREYRPFLQIDGSSSTNRAQIFVVVGEIPS